MEGHLFFEALQAYNIMPTAHERIMLSIWTRVPFDARKHFAADEW